MSGSRDMLTPAQISARALNIDPTIRAIGYSDGLEGVKRDGKSWTLFVEPVSPDQAVAYLLGYAAGAQERRMLARFGGRSCCDGEQAQPGELH